jgi:hypothetical protein
VQQKNMCVNCVIAFLILTLHRCSALHRVDDLCVLPSVLAEPDPFLRPEPNRGRSGNVTREEDEYHLIILGAVEATTRD